LIEVLVIANEVSAQLRAADIAHAVIDYMNRDSELWWIRGASGADRLLLVRLSASERTLGERVGRREIGSAHDDQLARTLVQAHQLAEGGRDASARDRDRRAHRA
jgi:hypothetical protein